VREASLALYGAFEMGAASCSILLNQLSRRCRPTPILGRK
jgi:hypothetical protein